MKKAIVLALILFIPLFSEAKHVNGYYRQDGTYVSGYERGSKGDPTIQLITVGIVVVAIAAIGIAYGIQRMVEKGRREKLAKRAREIYSKWSNQIYSIGYLPARPIGLNLKPNEIGYIQMNNVVLLEPKSIRQSVHTGGAVRIAKGITVGRGYSTSESHEEWRPISTGTLYITNKRIVFDGDMQNRSVGIDSLISVQVGDIQVAITSSSRQKTMVFDMLNGRVVGHAIELIQSGNCEGEC